MATFEMADGRKFVIKTFPHCAPITARNFLYLISQGFYDGTVFHRVLPGFVIQGGCPDGSGRGNPGWRIKGEFKLNLVPNGLCHMRGYVGMAREDNDADSAGSQFYINLARNRAIDHYYCIFGEVTEGMAVIDSIAAVPTDEDNRPLEPQVIVRAYIDDDERDYAHKPEVIELDEPEPEPVPDPAEAAIDGLEQIAESIGKIAANLENNQGAPQPE